MSLQLKHSLTIRFIPQAFFVGLTIVYCVLFPADKLNIKEIILAFTLLINLPCIIDYVKRDSGKTRLVFYGMLFPIVLTIYALIQGVSLGATLSYGYVWIFLFLIPPIVYFNIDIKKPFIAATILVAIMVDFIYITDLIGVVSIFSNPLVRFFDSMNELQYGKGILATFGYSIFYKS